MKRLNNGYIDLHFSAQLIYEAGSVIGDLTFKRGFNTTIRANDKIEILLRISPT